MKVTHSLAQLQKEHVVLELECIDRMYLNAYVPKLTSKGGIAAFCRGYLGHRFASTKQAVAMTKAFVKSIEAFIQRKGLELVRFQKGQRKDEVLQQKLRGFKKVEGVIFVGVAQEKVRVPLASGALWTATFLVVLITPALLNLSPIFSFALDRPDANLSRAFSESNGKFNSTSADRPKAPPLHRLSHSSHASNHQTQQSDPVGRCFSQYDFAKS
jgi:hypothetical protein